MSSEALGRGETIREALDVLDDGSPEEIHAAANEALDALLVEVARLEQAATEARYRYQDNLAASFRERDSLAAALAVAREREQRAVQALTEIAAICTPKWHISYTDRVIVIRRIARAALVDEPAAAETGFGECAACGGAVERVGWDDLCFSCQESEKAEAEPYDEREADQDDDPAAATLAEPEQATDESSAGGWSGQRQPAGAESAPTRSKAPASLSPADEPRKEWASAPSRRPRSRRTGRDAVSASPAKLLHAAQNACGDHAVSATARDDFTAAREWQALAAECARLLRDAVAVSARGGVSPSGKERGE